LRQLEEFVRTGDPWIDSGIISLWEILATRHSDKLSRKKNSEEIRLGKTTATLSSDSLMLKGPAQRIRRLPDEALKRLTDAVWRETKKGKMWWSGAALFFFKQQSSGPKRFLTTLDQLVRKGTKGTCDFCGRTSLRVTEARTSEHPFLVKSQKMSSFYSQLKGAFNICSFCTFASWFAIPNIFFNVDWNESTLNAFFFDAPDLVHLARLQYALGRHRATEEPYRNFKGTLSYAKHPLENFVSFLLAIYKEMAMKSALVQGVTVHVFSARLDGRKVSFIRYYTVPSLPRVLNVLALMEWQSATRQHNALEDVMRRFYFIHGGVPDTVIREELARRFFTSSEIADVTEDFLFRRILSEEGGLPEFEIVSLYQLTDRYHKEVLKLDFRILNAARSLGDILGTVAAEKDDKSILYSLRGLRSLEDYYAYLHQFVTRHEDSIQGKANMRSTIDTITCEIDERNWRSHRSLVGIYAVLKHIDILNQRKKMKKPAEVT